MCRSGTTRLANPLHRWSGFRAAYPLGHNSSIVRCVSNCAAACWSRPKCHSLGPLLFGLSQPIATKSAARNQAPARTLRDGNLLLCQHKMTAAERPRTAANRHTRAAATFPSRLSLATPSERRSAFRAAFAIEPMIPNPWAPFSATVTPSWSISSATVFAERPNGAHFSRTAGLKYGQVWMVLPQPGDLIVALPGSRLRLAGRQCTALRQSQGLRRQLDKNSSNGNEAAIERRRRSRRACRRRLPRPVGARRRRRTAGHAGGTLKQVAKPDVIKQPRGGSVCIIAWPG